MRLAPAMALAVALGGIAAGCGTSKSSSTSTTKSTSTATSAAARTVDDQQVEQGIQSSLSTSTVKVTKASCPADVPVQSGGTFSCSVTFSNGATGKVTVTQKGAGQYSYAVTPGSVQIPGSEVDQQIEAQLAKQGISGATVTCPQTIIVKVGTTVTCDVSGAQGLAGGTVTFTFSNADGTVDPSSVKTS